MINTRHSIGMRFVNRLAQHLSMSWEKQRKLNAFIARKSFDMLPTLSSPEPVSLDLVLLKSTLPMNLNGRSIKSAGRALIIFDMYLICIAFSKSFSLLLLLINRRHKQNCPKSFA